MLEVLEPFLDRITKLESDNAKYCRLLQENRDALRDNQKAMEDLIRALGKEVKLATNIDKGPSGKKKKWDIIKSSIQILSSITSGPQRHLTI